MRINSNNQNNYDLMKLLTQNKNNSATQVQKYGFDNPIPGFKMKTTNSDGMTGMCGDGHVNKIVKVTDEIRDKVTSSVLESFIEYYGKGPAEEGDKQAKIMKSYVYSLPENERLDAMWTLNNIGSDEASRIRKLVENHIPGWKPGDPFNKDEIRKLISQKHVDKKI